MRNANPIPETRAPMSETEHFVVEAALQLGFDFLDETDDSKLCVSERDLVQYFKLVTKESEYRKETEALRLKVKSLEEDVELQILRGKVEALESVEKELAFCQATSIDARGANERLRHEKRQEVFVAAVSSAFVTFLITISVVFFLLAVS